MPLYAFHASHEQFPPSLLVKLAIAAEKAGFDAVHSSDHFHPWSKRQGQSGFSFSWIGAAMQATSIPFSMVCAPGQRYHPAIVAQAIATLGELFPGRFSIELGSGEAINECITGEEWPAKEQRNKRLEEAVQIIRRLLAGEKVTHHGLNNVREARLFTRPSKMPLLFGAALSETTCAWVGSWGDGLLTTGGDVESTRNKIDAFRSNAGPDKPVYLQVSFSYAGNVEEATAGAYDQWRSNLLSTEQLADISTTEEFDVLAENITRDDVSKAVKMITSIRELMDWLAPLEELGVSCISLHNIHPDQDRFIRDYGIFRLAHHPHSYKSAGL